MSIESETSFLVPQSASFCSPCAQCSVCRTHSDQITPPDCIGAMQPGSQAANRHTKKTGTTANAQPTSNRLQDSFPATDGRALTELSQRVCKLLVSILELDTTHDRHRGDRVRHTRWRGGREMLGRERRGAERTIRGSARGRTPARSSTSATTPAAARTTPGASTIRCALNDSTIRSQRAT